MSLLMRARAIAKVSRDTYRRTPVVFHPIGLRRHRAATAQFRTGNDLRLHLGCGSRRIDGFINIDMNRSGATDYVADISRLPIRTGSVARIETYHVIEHIPYPAVGKVLAHWAQLLKRGGTLVMECPDFDQDLRDYLAGVQPHERLGSIYGWQRFPGDAHHWGYNVERLSELVKSVGFSAAHSEPPQDYHAKNEPCIRVVATR